MARFKVMAARDGKHAWKAIGRHPVTGKIIVIKGGDPNHRNKWGKKGGKTPEQVRSYFARHGKEATSPKIYINHKNWEKGSYIGKSINIPDYLFEQNNMILENVNNIINNFENDFFHNQMLKQFILYKIKDFSYDKKMNLLGDPDYLNDLKFRVHRKLIRNLMFSVFNNIKAIPPQKQSALMRLSLSMSSRDSISKIYSILLHELLQSILQLCTIVLKFHKNVQAKEYSIKSFYNQTFVDDLKKQYFVPIELFLKEIKSFTDNDFEWFFSALFDYFYSENFSSVRRINDQLILKINQFLNNKLRTLPYKNLSQFFKNKFQKILKFFLFLMKIDNDFRKEFLSKVDKMKNIPYKTFENEYLLFRKTPSLSQKKFVRLIVLIFKKRNQIGYLLNAELNKFIKFGGLVKEFFDQYEDLYTKAIYDEVNNLK